MREINLNRQKLGLEDLLFGVGIVTQIRAGQNVDVTRINAGNLPFDETQTLLEWVQSTNLEVLGSMTTELQAIYDNLTTIGNVEANLTVINTLEDNLVALQSLYTNIAKLQNIDTNMHKLQNIDTNMSKLQNIDTNMSKLQAIYIDLTKLESIYDNLTMLTAIYNNLTALNNINSQVIPNLTELLLVNDNAAQVAADKLTVSTDKGIVVGYKDDVSAMKVDVETIYDTFNNSTSTSASQALTSRNQAETFAQQAEASAESIDVNNLVHRIGDETVAGIKTFSSNIVGSITGNADSATKLATARTINGVSFDGSANITAPTDLGITAGTTAGPIVTSSTGTNATLPTASATASGVVTTGNQTVAGIKTFTSSPIVPTPTADFQSVPLKSTNITVNVGVGQTYTTINQALEYLSGFYPMYKKSGVIATINLKAGFVMAEQVLVSGIDLGWITIVGEDAETIITHTALTTAFNSAYPAFGVDKGGTSPVIGQLFRFNVEKVGGNKHGLLTVGAGSSANVLPSKGFIGAGTSGIQAEGASTVNANSANCSNAGSIGICADLNSTINANSANCSNAGSTGMYVGNTSIIDANSADCSNAGTYGILATRGATVNATAADCSNAGSIGIYADLNSTINAYQALIKNQTAGVYRVRVTYGSHIGVGFINITGGTVTAFSQAINTLTGHGIIYQ